MKDLVVLVADIQQEKTIQVLLSDRHRSLNIKKPDFQVFRHSERDPGIYARGGKFLYAFRNQFDYALVILDKEWEGSPNDTVAMARKLQVDLDNEGWQNRSKVIIIDPELEVWVWSNSPHVYTILGMDLESIRALGETSGYWLPGHDKPLKPKELLENTLRLSGKRRSAALFAKLAETVGLASCRDPSFLQLRRTLARWFPP